MSEARPSPAAPWQTDDFFKPIPTTPYAAYDGQTWHGAVTPQQFEELLRTTPGATTGPFCLPGRPELVSRWEVPGLAEFSLRALREGNRATVQRAALLSVLLGGFAAYQSAGIGDGSLGNMGLWLIAIIFGFMPLTSAVVEAWQLGRPHPLLPGTMSDLRFAAWMRGQRSPVTYGILGVLVVVYLATCWASSPAGALELEPSNLVLLRWGANVKPLVWDGEWWRLATCMFLHASPVHIAFNALALYQLGRVAEALLGPWRTAATFLACGLAGSVLSLLLSDRWSVGASGAVCGLMGVLVAFSWTDQSPSFLGRAAQSMIVALMVLGFLGAGFVDNAGHAGGLGAGLLIGWLYFRRRFAARLESARSA